MKTISDTKLTCTVFSNMGYEYIDQFLSQEQIQCLREDIGHPNLSEISGGIRNADKKFNSIKKLSSCDYLSDQARNYLGSQSKPKLVRSILFCKSTENNWLVSWHQDRTVTVSKKFANPDWGPWTIKDEVIHVQPPIEVLNKMVSFRIHLDDSDENNGCLKLFPKSHKLGLIDQDAIQELKSNHSSINCIAKAGSALIMRPHLLHSSSKSKNGLARRVLHLEYSSFSLPPGISWA